MRITQGIMTKNLVKNLSQLMKDLDQIQQQMTTGKKVTKPSDDPIAIDDSLRLRTGLAQIKQYQGNIVSANSWLKLTESALSDTSDIIHRVKELATEGANGTQTEESREAAAKEVDELLSELAQLANTSLSGRYIFGGTKTDQPPYDAATGTWNGNTGTIQYEIGAGMTIDVNTIGSNVFTGGGGADSLFTILQNVAQDLRANNTTDLGGVRLDELEKALDNTLNYTTEIGAKQNRMEMAANRMEESELNFTEILSETEDIDMLEVLMNLATVQTAYSAALSAGAKIIQPSLVDFID